MKSVIALLAIIACANALTLKEVGLLGRFEPMIAVTSTEDTSPPTLDFTQAGYTGWSGFAMMNNMPMSNVTFSYDYGYLDFTVADSGVFAADLEYIYPMAWLDNGAGCMIYASYCDTYSDMTTECYFDIPQHVPAGTYVASVVVADALGNWMMYSSTDATADPAFTSFVIADNTPDVTMPNIQSVDASPLTSSITEFTTSGIMTAYVEFTVMCDDSMGTKTTDDPNSSGIMGASVMLTDSTTAATWTWDLSCTTDYSVDPYTSTCGLRINWYNWADDASWIVNNYNVWDVAGNMVTQAASGTLIVMTSNVDPTTDIAACQQFYVGLYGFSSPSGATLDVSGTVNDPEYFYTATVQFTGECTGTYTDSGTGFLDYYGGFSYMSPMITKNGNAMYYDIQSSNYAGGSGPMVSATNSMGLGFSNCGGDSYAVNPIMMQYMVTVLGDTTIDDPYVGATMFAATSGGSALYFEDYWGVASGQENGFWMLYNLFTVTDTGAVKLYTSLLGSGSNVVPSVIIVAVSLVAAMFRF